MFRMETNGETDHLQRDLFVDISYKFTLAQGFCSNDYEHLPKWQQIGTFYMHSVLYGECPYIQ